MSFIPDAGEATIFIATPFAMRTSDFVDSLIFDKPSRLDLSHGSNLLPPPHRLQEAIIKASVWGSSIALYDSPYGPASLRELISEYENQLHEDKISKDNIFITLGGVDGLSLYFRARANQLNKKTEPKALLIGSQYPTISRIAEAAGFTVAMTRYSDSNYQLFSAAILEWQPNAVILTQPSNPLGTFITEEEFATLCSACSFIESDIVIDRVCGDIPSVYYKQSPRFRTIAKEYGVKLTEIESYSKRRGVPGLRIGYNIMPPEYVRWCANAVTGRTVSSIGCAVAECDATAFLENDTEYVEHIIDNHRIVSRNIDTMKKKLGSQIVNCSSPSNGANFLVSVLLPRTLHESSAAIWLHKYHQLGTYPISCFELWPEKEESEIMRIRITAATPPEEFDEAVDVLSSALSKSNVGNCETVKTKKRTVRQK